MSTQLLPGPLHPDLFEPELTPSVLAVEEDTPRWRAVILHTDIELMSISDNIQEMARACAERAGANGYEILAINRVSACCPFVVQIGYTYHLDIIADSSHEAIQIADRIASQRWPGSEVIGVDLIVPDPTEEESNEKTHR